MEKIFSIIWFVFFITVICFVASYSQDIVWTPDGKITDHERSAYAEAWRNGDKWVVGPDPILLDYVANAYLIYRSGGTYIFDPNLPPPKCWTPSKNNS